MSNVSQFKEIPHLMKSFVYIALALLGPVPAFAQESKFDGTWNVAMTCPPHNAEDDDAKGYIHRFLRRFRRAASAALMARKASLAGTTFTARSMRTVLQRCGSMAS